MKKLLLIIISFILVLSFFSGCGINAASSASFSSKTAAIISPSPSPTIAPTPMPSPSPSPTPTLSIDEVKLNQRIQDFLNKTGAYTEEKMKEKTILVDDGKETKLGMVNSNFDMEGWLFDSRLQGDYIMLTMGFDGKDGNRFITELAIPVYAYEKANVDNFSFVFARMDTQSMTNGWGPDSSFKTGEEILARLDKLEDGPLVFTPIRKKFTSSLSGYDDVTVKFVNDYNSKVDYANELCSEVVDNGLNLRNNVSNGIYLVKITSVEEIGSVDIASVPIIGNLVMFYQPSELE